MGIDVIGGGRPCDGIVCLFSGKYPQNHELVCDSGEQTMAVWVDLEIHQSDQWTTQGMCHKQTLCNSRPRSLHVLLMLSSSSFVSLSIWAST